MALTDVAKDIQGKDHAAIGKAIKRSKVCVDLTLTTKYGVDQLITKCIKIWKAQKKLSK